jgi:hypothetical protein
MAKNATAAALMGLLYADSRTMRPFALTEPKELPQRTCRLPGCDETTCHPGGFCCVAHHERYTASGKADRKAEAKWLHERAKQRRKGKRNG